MSAEVRSVIILLRFQLLGLAWRPLLNLEVLHAFARLTNLAFQQQCGQPVHREVGRRKMEFGLPIFFCTLQLLILNE